MHRRPRALKSVRDPQIIAAKVSVPYGSSVMTLTGAAALDCSICLYVYKSYASFVDVDKSLLKQ